jgi:hypothetical protein
MDLRHLTDKVLLTDTKFLVSRERELSTKILHHLKEIERRRLYSDLGFTSLFDYCMRELGYAESSAIRRIQSARLLNELPQIESKIEDGSLSLTNLSLLNQFFKNGEITNVDEKMAIMAKVENKTKKECEKELFIISGKEAPVIKDTTKRISKDKSRYNITLSDETAEAIEAVKSLLNKNLSLDEIIMLMAKRTIDFLQKEKFKLNKTKILPPPVHVNRVIPAATKKEVFLRDQKCTKCGTTHRLQFDHQIPFSMGGDSTSKNIRLLCFNCNQRARIRAKL